MIEVVLLTISKNPIRTEYIYRFKELNEAIQFVEISLKNGYEVDIRKTEG